jgi:hypothetical protein
MNELLIPVAIALALLTLLFFAAAGSGYRDEDILDHERRFRAGSRSMECSPALLRQLFSRQDLEFVSTLGHPPLLRLLRRERKGIALHWVKQVSAEISGTMREHTRNSRSSASIKAGVEMEMLLRFAGLRILCGLIVVLMRFVDLHFLLGLANRAGKMADEFPFSKSRLGMNSASTPPATFNAQ